MKPLLPVLKEKKRYVAFEVRSKKTMKFETVKKEIEGAAKDFMGINGVERMGLMFLDEWKNQKGIVRVNNKYVDYFKSSLVLMNTENFMARSLLVSGTLKKLRGNI